MPRQDDFQNGFIHPRLLEMAERLVRRASTTPKEATEAQVTRLARRRVRRARATMRSRYPSESAYQVEQRVWAAFTEAVTISSKTKKKAKPNGSAVDPATRRSPQGRAQFWRTRPDRPKG